MGVIPRDNDAVVRKDKIPSSLRQGGGQDVPFLAFLRWQWSLCLSMPGRDMATGDSEGVGSVGEGEHAPGLKAMAVQMEKSLRGAGGTGPEEGDQPHSHLKALLYTMPFPGLLAKQSGAIKCSLLLKRQKSTPSCSQERRKCSRIDEGKPMGS